MTDEEIQKRKAAAAERRAQLLAEADARRAAAGQAPFEAIFPQPTAEIVDFRAWCSQRREEDEAGYCTDY